MTIAVQTIPLTGLAIGFVPAALAAGILFYWSMNGANALYALARMLLQLLLIGYFLTYIFETPSPGLILSILTVMVLASSWIALGSLTNLRRTLFVPGLAAIGLAGGGTLVLVTQAVLQLEPWYEPRYLVPLAGMIFANAMNAVSLAAERMHAELQRHQAVDSELYCQSRNAAFHAAMIPIINSLFAVGLVSLPGMMTGQILSGVSPLIAVRYQIMVMCMIFGSGAMATALFLIWARPVFARTTSAATGE